MQKTLEEATQLNRDFTVAAVQDLDKWATALQPVLDNAGYQIPTWSETEARPATRVGSPATRSYPSQTDGHRSADSGGTREDCTPGVIRRRKCTGAQVPGRR